MSNQFDKFDEVWETRENTVRTLLRDIVECDFTLSEHKIEDTLLVLKAIGRTCYVTGSLDGVREAADAIGQEKS
jgi:hypothetical protein